MIRFFLVYGIWHSQEVTKTNRCPMVGSGLYLLTPTAVVIWDVWKNNPRPFQGLGPESYTRIATKRTFGKTEKVPNAKGFFALCGELHEQNPNQI